jgi:hypothetical protein
MVMVNDYVVNPNILLGKRIKLTDVMNDPFPIEVGSEGVVYNVGYDVVNVRWDNGRSLGLIIGEDKFEIID